MTRMDSIVTIDEGEADKRLSSDAPTIPDLSDILGLRPQQVTAATLSEAINQASTLREAMMQHANALIDGRGEMLLRSNESDILDAEMQAAKARLAADRLDALLIELRKDHSEAVEAEYVEAALVDMARMHAAALEAIEELVEWREDYETIRRLVGKGLYLNQRAEDARQRLLGAVENYYTRAAIRARGPLALPEPTLPELLPSRIFPGWSITS